MLQPLQLKDVLLRYPGEIAELRGFLGKAGFAPGTAAALSAVATAVHGDRAFHRDLMLHVWLLLDRSDGQISPSDLLGVLAVAAAGEHFAAEASEDDAHVLLRFVMEARRSMDAPTSRGAAELERSVEQRVGEPQRVVQVARPIQTTSAPDIPVDASAVAAETPWITQRASPDVPFEPVELPSPQTVERGGGKRTAWVIALALCLLALVSVAVWHLRKQPSAADGAAPSVVSTPAGSSATDVSSARVEAPEAADSGEAIGSKAAASARAGSASTVVPRELRPAPLPVPRAAVTPSRGMSGAGAPIVRTPASVASAATPAPRPATTAAASPMVARSGPAHPATAAVPAGTLSSRLGSSTIPAYAALPDADATTDGRKYPRLLRRRTASSTGSGVLAADLRPAGSTNASGSTPAIPVGVVRTTSIGIMAGNLLSSPTPAYPTAAAAAHVQGEVKVQAEIDRDGNVVSARVVSGPPMLRDAAVDAIQHWRYKPWTSGGKPAPMSAIAVIDFQLP